MPIEPGAHVNPSVRLVQPLGKGGMGSVWIAEHLSLQTQVVVKFMSAELAKDARNVQRFAREAAAASQVKSPHVVQMFDHGVTSENVPYIVMELLEGKDLAHHIVARGRLAPGEVATVLTQICKALSKAHEKGIVHRDIKPENIFVVEGDELYVKLLDFGIAKGTGALSNHTGTGSMIGTPYYMSPEQILGAKTIDYRADIWSLGIVAFEALTGRKPLEADTIGALAVKIHGGQLPQPSQYGLPATVDAWFARACASDPNARFQSAKEMAHTFTMAIGGNPSMQMSALPTLPTNSAPVAHSQSSGWGATPPPSQRPPVVLAGPSPPPPPPAYSPSTHFESSATPPPEPAKRSRAPLFIVLAVVLLALGVGGFALVTKLSDPPTSAGKGAEEPTPAEAPSKKKKKAKSVGTGETNEEPPTKAPEPDNTAKKPAPPASTTAPAWTPPPLPPPIKTASPPSTAKKNNDDDIK